MRNVVEPATQEGPTVALESVPSGAGRTAGNLPVLSPAGSNVFRAGDVLFSKLRPYLAKSLHVEQTLQGSGEFLCLRPTATVPSRYLHYYVLSRPWVEHAVTTSYGTKMPRTSWEQMASHRLPDMEACERARIADFLDDRVSRIDRIIAARRHQSSKVRQLTRSRVEALVRPASEPMWLHGPLRRFATSMDSKRVPLSSEERSHRQGGVPYYGASGVIDFVDDFLFDSKHILVSEDGANLLLRSKPIAFTAKGRYWVNNHAHILEPRDGAHEFWAERIESTYIAPWVTGSAQPKLTIDALMDLPVTAPREPEERHRIGKLVTEVRRAEGVELGHLTRSLELFTEYKQSLITAAVTGQLDVTTASTRIPE